MRAVHHGEGVTGRQASRLYPLAQARVQAPNLHSKRRIQRHAVGRDPATFRRRTLLA